MSIIGWGSGRSQKGTLPYNESPLGPNGVPVALQTDQQQPAQTNPIARFAVTRRLGVAMIATAIIVLGVFALPRLPIALLPTFSPPVINVSVTYPNVNPESMETLITRPIENAVSRVPGIDTIESTSSEGNSRIRAQRLAASFNHGWAIRSNRMNSSPRYMETRSPCGSSVWPHTSLAHSFSQPRGEPPP